MFNIIGGVIIKNFFKKLTLHKMDEMEMEIDLWSLRWCWLFLMLFLAFWSCYECLKVLKTPEAHINLIPFILIISQGIIKYISKTIYNKIMSEKTNEE